MARGLMSNLATPAYLIDRDGTLVFYNEAAGELLGLTFEEAGPMPAEEWGARFEPTRPDGSPLALEELPLASRWARGVPRTLRCASPRPRAGRTRSR